MINQGKPDTKLELVGGSPGRVNASNRATGKAVYIGDMKLPGMLYGRVLRSTMSHARILGIDSGEAEKLPGVKGVVIGCELPFLHGESMIDEPFLAREKVRYLGEGVAAVAAVDEDVAEAAVALINVSLEELPALLDPVAAAKPGAPLIHETMDSYSHKSVVNPVSGTNICNHIHFQQGDVEKGFTEADFILEDTFTSPRQQHCSIEPHGAICLVDDEDNVTLWTNNDSPYRCRIEIANSLRLPLTKVRIITAPTIGGNFGGKGGLKAEAPAIALAWKIRNKPIKVMYSREEEFCSSIVRHAAVVTVKTGVKKDGTIIARKVETYWTCGAYAEKGPTVSLFGGVSAIGPYKIPNVSVDGYLVYTNTQVGGAMRGYGGPQTAWAYESQMDIIAAKLKIDPLELRLKQIYQDGDTHSITGQQLHSEGLKECLTAVAESMDWGKKSLGKNRGRGLACMERAVKTPFGSAAFVKVNEDGTVDILSSTTEVGQGSETILSQIVAEQLGVSLQMVRKATPDTAFTPFDASTTSSRSTFHMGNAVKIAAADAREQILKLASNLLEVSSEDLDIKGGNVHVKGVPGKGLTIAEVLGGNFGGSATVLGRGYYFPHVSEETGGYFSLNMVFWMLGAHGVEVEVDETSGQVKILKIYAAQDSGKAINPEFCVGQIQGGVSMGLGYSLHEEMLMKGGQVMNPSFLNYAIPTAMDMPEIVPLVVEYAHREGPYGAKGMGETTNVATPPALANAIFDAIGVRIKELPITPDKVLKALEQKRLQSRPN